MLPSHSRPWNQLNRWTQQHFTLAGAHFSPKSLVTKEPPIRSGDRLFGFPLRGMRLHRRCFASESAIGSTSFDPNHAVPAYDHSK
jgi:hypothetical protein